MERRGEAGGWRLATMARWRHKPNWRPHDLRYDAAAVARPQGEGTRGRDDDVGALLGRRIAVAVLQAEGGAGIALGEGRPAAGGGSGGEASGGG